MSQQLAQVLIALVLLLPLTGSVLNALVGPIAPRWYVNWVGPLAVLGAFVVTCIAFVHVLGAADTAKSTTIEMWQWINLTGLDGPCAQIVSHHGNLCVGADFLVDPLTVVMMLVITGVGFLIHVYSVGYMEHDEDVARFFAYMNFFIFSMLVLVLAANVAILIVGWALVALSSYLLIGFWYQRPSAVVASRKAFVTQVIGDVALVLAAFMIIVRLSENNVPDPLSYQAIFSTQGLAALGAGGSAWVTGVCILIAVGAFAKSAQFPLHTWLPDAMEGPTPVSALIHAATMVTAGVYLIARFHLLFNMAPVAQAIVACVGMGTALMAGIIALSQVDIKRVIAYSTMSQIGLMIFAVGVGAYAAGMFHFVTHAVFKALLFMAAGNVIHALHDEQDIRLMGGLQKKMAGTYWSFLFGSLALAGIPIWAGWWSKEGLLGYGVSNGGLYLALYVVGLGVNILTGLYAFRLLGTAFMGQPQTARVYAAHEAPRVMLIPVMLLAIGAFGIGFLEAPWTGTASWHLFHSFLDTVFGTNAPGAAVEPGAGAAWAALLFGTLASVLASLAAWSLWVKRGPETQQWFQRIPRTVALLSFHKFYFDEIYDAVLVRPTSAIARSMKRIVEPRAMDGWVRGVSQVLGDLGATTSEWQTGLVRDYAGVFLAVAVIGVVATAVGFAR